jgi:hypothetical protein
MEMHASARASYAVTTCLVSPTTCALLLLQYGGSEAHAAFFQKKRGEWDATTQSRDLMTSIRCGQVLRPFLPSGSRRVVRVTATCDLTVNVRHPVCMV